MKNEKLINVRIETDIFQQIMGSIQSMETIFFFYIKVNDEGS